MRMFRLFVLCVVAFFSFEASAFTINGISYVDVTRKGLKVTGATGYDVVIPDSVLYNDSTYAVTAIGERAFYSKEVYSVTLPSTVKTIESQAFQLSKLTSIILPEGLETIGNSAFQQTSNLREISLPSTLTSIGSSAFYSSGIYKIEIPEGIVKLNSSTFISCQSLSSVSLPSSLKVIDQSCFSQCTALTEIELPEGLVSIGSSALANTSLRKIKIPNLVSSIPSAAFGECSYLREVNLPKNLTSIEMNAFKNCESLQSISLPNMTKTISNGAFYGCKRLKDIYIPASIGEGTYDISRAKYQYTSEYCFYGCDSICNVHIRRLIPPVFHKSSFIHAKTDTIASTLYVPKGKAEQYALLDCFKAFGKIVEENIEISMESRRNMFVGDKHSMIVMSVPDIYPLGALDWKSSNSNIVKVDNYGNITALAPGSAIITASADIEDERKEAQCIITVSAIPTSTFNIVKKSFVADTKGYLPVEMTNQDKIISFQCDVVLPDGISMFKDDEDEFDFTWGERQSRRHILESRLLETGTVRVVGYATDNSSFSGNNGILFNIPLQFASIPGDYRIELKNILVTDDTLAETSLPSISEIIEVGRNIIGDANGDGRVTINDAAYVSAYILGEEPAGFNIVAADVESDGKITLADISGIVNIVLGVTPSASSPAKISVKHNANGYGNPTREGDKMFIRNLDLKPGETATIEVEMDNAEPFISFHSEIVLPEGVEFIEEDGEYWVDLGASRKTRSHTIASRLQPDGRLRVVAVSSSNSVFKGNNGVLFTVDVKAASDFNDKIASEIRLENNYICNKNESNGFTDYDVPDYKAIVNPGSSEVDDLHQVDNLIVYVTSGNILNIISPSDCETRLVSADGIQKVLRISEGHNQFTIPSAGIYMVENHKIAIR